MSDLISRTWLLNVVENIIEWDTERDRNRIIHQVRELTPSAQPEPKKGKWVRYDGDWLKTMCKCSECGAMIDINKKYRNFFCYHCGARMDGEQV